MNNNQSARWGILPRYVSWLTIVLALLAIGTFIALSSPEMRYATMSSGGGTAEYRGSVPPAMDTSAPDSSMKGGMYYPYPTDVPVTDTREFLKIYYNASMRTRDVPALTRRVETTVRGYDGRIDQQSSSLKYGYVSFALPQVKYDAFRTELEELVGSRFLVVSISSQNLLSQKVSIEEQQKQADTTLADYKAARQKVVNTHANLVQALQAKIAAPETTASEKASLEQQLANENVVYASQLSNADAQIKYAQDWAKAVQTQDQTLLANVATVTGTVSLQWISLWEVAQLYLPGYWIPSIFTFLTVLSFLRDRRRAIVLVA